MVQRFNDHYKKNFEHCQKVTVDELILWGWTRDQLGGGHKVDTEPRGFGPEYKCLYAVGVQVTTIFEHMRRKEVNNKSKYTKEYGSGAASVLCLCEAYGIYCINYAVISYRWFGGISCVLGLL